MRCLNIFLLSTLVSTIAAVPAGSSITPPAPFQPVPYLSQCSDRRRPWTRLRDWAIESVWGIQHSRTSVKHGAPPANVRDRYETDVVLRFHLGHPNEAEALASASQVLVLDVWAITSEYVDIRLAENMVRLSVPWQSFLDLVTNFESVVVIGIDSLLA